MTHTVQELALKYAEALVEYHEARQSDVCDKARWVREATDAMYEAQNALDEACAAAAQRNYS